MQDLKQNSLCEMRLSRVENSHHGVCVMKTCTLAGGYRRLGGTRCYVAIVVHVIVAKCTTVNTVQDCGV